MNEKPNPNTANKTGLSCVVKGLLGCGCLMLVLTGIGAVSGFIGIRFLFDQLDSFAQPYMDKGYERVIGQVVNETSKVEKKKIYTAQVVKLQDGSTTDLAFMVQMVEISGTVDGNIDFMGQILTIKKGAVVTGNINAKNAQVIVIHGDVLGEITGKYQTLRDTRPPKKPERIPLDEDVRIEPGTDSTDGSSSQISDDE